MAQLNDTMVQGDLRVTGKIYGTNNVIHLENANLAIPPIGVGDYAGSTGDFFIGAGGGKNLPDTTNNFNIHTTVTHFTGTNYRLSQIATPTAPTNPVAIYERGGSSSDGVTWTFGSWANANSDTKVTQTKDDSGTTAYPVLIAGATDPNGSATTARYDSGVKLTPSTNTISANISGNAATASKVSVTDQEASTGSNSHVSYILGWDTSSQSTSPIIPVKNSRVYSTLYNSKSTFTCDSIRALDDGASGGKLEPYLTVHRGFSFSGGSVTPDNRLIESIGYYENDTIDAKNTFNNFGLLFKYSYGILRYKSAYVISYNYTPDSSQPNYPQPDYTISAMKFWGTSIESLHANSADYATSAGAATDYLTAAQAQFNISDTIDYLNDNKAQVYKKTYTSNTSGLTADQYHDWNDLVDTGIYELQGDSNGDAPNNPESGAMTLFVINVNLGTQTYVKQLAMGTQMYTRAKQRNGSWTTGGWYKLVTSQYVHNIDCSGTVGTSNGVLYFT